MSNLLVISGHPNSQASFAGKNILIEFAKLVPSAEIVQLDALYPNFNIDGAKEQERLLGAQSIVFQFPFWWYSSPSLMHRYVEQVFTHGFAYGSKGIHLRGKKLILSFTTGSAQENYSATGSQEYDISIFIPPFLAMTHLCGLYYQGAVISYGMALLNPGDKNLREEILKKCKAHAERLAKLINS